MLKHPKLFQAVVAKHKDNPNLKKGITVRDGVLVEFHPDIGPYPTDAQLQQWIDEYEAAEAAKVKPSKPTTLKGLIDMLIAKGVFDESEFA